VSAFYGGLVRRADGADGADWSDGLVGGGGGGSLAKNAKKHPPTQIEAIGVFCWRRECGGWNGEPPNISY
jgi:hypothetical protein